jgi:hypothetical protein
VNKHDKCPSGCGAFSSMVLDVQRMEPIRVSRNQDCGFGSVSGSGLDPDSIGSVDPHPDPGGQK